jgi:hypothetical protein
MTRLQATIEAPTKLSDAIDIALEDFKIIRTDPRYEIDMTKWHEPDMVYDPSSDEDRPACAVCFAGTVMARRFPLDPGTETNPRCGDFSDAWKNTFNALDYLRGGHVSSAVGVFPNSGLTYNKALDMDRPITSPLIADGVLFIMQMELLAADLRKVGA